MTRSAALAIFALVVAAAIVGVWYWRPGQRQRRLDSDIVLCRQLGATLVDNALERCMRSHGWDSTSAAAAELQESVRVLERLRR